MYMSFYQVESLNLITNVAYCWFYGTLIICKWMTFCKKLHYDVKGDWPYFATTHVFKLIINSLSSSLILHNFSLFFLNTSLGQIMVMDFCPRVITYMFFRPSTKRLWNISFIHSHEGYGITFKPLNNSCYVWQPSWGHLLSKIILTFLCSNYF